MLNPLSPLHLASAIAFGAFSAFFAHKRGRNPYKWFFLGFFFGLLGLFATLLFLPSAKKKSASPMRVIKPQPRIQGPSEKFWYYLDIQHKQAGPVSYKALSDFLKSGSISLSTYVWNEDMEDWKILKELVKDAETEKSIQSKATRNG